jgi:hypothetical protein
MFLQYVPSLDVVESWLMPTLGVVPPPYSPFVSCEDEPMRYAQGGVVVPCSMRGLPTSVASACSSEGS